jgi:hypothetical protein
MRVNEAWRETCEHINNSRDLLRSEIEMLRGATTIIADERNVLRAENARLKKAASKLVMQVAQDFGRESTNPKQ